MTSLIYVIYSKKKIATENMLIEKKGPKHDCEEIPRQYFQAEESISVESSGAHSISKISANQDLQVTLG